MSDQQTILEILRESDRSAYVATLFAPEAKRDALAALWAFNAEIVRIPSLVSEPLPGEIRLQWWRDVIGNERADEGGQHPVGSALMAAIKEHRLPAQTFDALCEARIFDLYQDPMPSKVDFEGYLGETRSVLFQMGAQILLGAAPEKGDAAGHAGIAYGIAQILQSMAAHRAHRQVYMPVDLLGAAGLSTEQFLSIGDAVHADALVTLLVSLGRDHLAKAEAAIAELPAEARAAFVLLGVCAPIFKRAQKRGGAIALEPFSISPFTAQWYLTRFSMKL